MFNSSSSLSGWSSYDDEGNEVLYNNTDVVYNENIEELTNYEYNTSTKVLGILKQMGQVADTKINNLSNTFDVSIDIIKLSLLTASIVGTVMIARSIND